MAYYVGLLKNKARSLRIALCTELKPEPLTPFSLSLFQMLPSFN